MSLEREGADTPPTSSHWRRLPGNDLRSRRLERRLWTVAILALVLDVALSYYGIRLGVPELNPIVHHASERVGLLGALVLLKGFALAVAAVGVIVVPRRYRSVVPLALALPWSVAAVVNLGVLLSVQ